MKGIIEGLLFVKGSDGLSKQEIKNILNIDDEALTKEIKELYDEYQSDSRGIQLELLGDKFKLTTKPEHKEYYTNLTTEEANSPLTQSSLEVLAIIAYNEPITRIEIDEIRGLNSTYHLRKLLLKSLIQEVGRSELPGRPKQYGITNDFLDYFGLQSTDQLPEINVEEQASEETNLFESKYTEKNE